MRLHRGPYSFDEAAGQITLTLCKKQIKFVSHEKI